MNKAELVTSMAEKSELSKKDAEKALNSFIESVQGALSKGEKVQLVGFGSFEVRERAERKGRNPQTREEIVIPASKVPVFKVGKALKDAIK
ncbi:MAG: HU family DNA-binding protein [Firmicutes bacterium]|nr:HU family DNA-binding protein [Bacillota bacterium]